MTDTSLPLAGAIAGDTFRNLVRQFSQELCFYRELIQNSLDAGTRHVDVTVEYLDDKGMVRASVSDQGEGMDRTVIDTQLTRLFSSSKEDDFTKIGKFGIGFVSVFAIAPEAVVVDTGKGAEDWRVIFQPSGEFERVRLSTPVEGTTIQVFKKMPKAEFPGFVERSRETIRYWCRHSDVEIDFNGARINEPFDLESPLKVKVSEQGTEVVVGLVPEAQLFYGFYNGGITLLEGDGALLGSGQLLVNYSGDLLGVSLKIKSRYLEHTLTRDNVKQDANFEKA
ncbi:MAG: ATP-binding protein, partial [Candidatus Xenobia bacterium]